MAEFVAVSGDYSRRLRRVASESPLWTGLYSMSFRQKVHSKLQHQHIRQQSSIWCIPWLRPLSMKTWQNIIH